MTSSTNGAATIKRLRELKRAQADPAALAAAAQEAAAASAAALVTNPVSHLYDPPVCKRSIAELHDDLLQRADELYDLDRVVSCAERLEIGDGDLLTLVVKGHVLFDHAAGAFYFWNNLHWEVDPGDNIYRIASTVATTLYKRAAKEAFAAEVDGAGDGDEQAQGKRRVSLCRGRIKDMSRRRGAENALKFARATMGIGIAGDEWDKNIRLLGVANGVVDLVTGKAVRPQPDQYIRTVAPVNFDPAATCPTWERALHGIFDGDTEKAAYLQRVLGYAMTGECVESDFLVWHGKEGRNGKEFILDRVRACLGDKLAGSVEAELLLKSKAHRGANGATEGLMALYGRRLAWASETNEGQQMDLAKMKDLSGGHVMTGRHNYGKQIEWNRTHTIVLLTNNLPHVQSQSLAEWDRIKVLSFPLSFVDRPDPTKPYQRKKDVTLGRVIDERELSGVLNWLIAGGLDWRAEGMRPPASVTRDTAAYQKTEDTLGTFIEESCVIGEAIRSKPGELYNAYKFWFDGPRPMGKQSFITKIEERGFQRILYSGTLYFRGIGIRNDLMG